MTNTGSGGNMGRDGTIRTISREFDWTKTPPSVGAIRLLSVAMNCDPVAVDPLGETVDTDALDRLLVSLDEDASVSFSHSGLSLLLTGDGTASVSPED